MTSTDHARNKTTAKDLLLHSGSEGFVIKIPAGIRRSPTPPEQRTSLRGA